MLKATLGSAFTAEEGERVFEQTFDPFASSEENVKNMQTELSKIEKRKNLIEQQGEVFKQRKTLAGYEAPETMPSSNRTVTIVGPSGQEAKMTEENAKKYLSKPGYKRVD
jgi:hypothetical protein